MAQEWRTKTFKSGNSVAIRIPKAVGLKEGEEVVVAPHSDGSISLWRASDTRGVLMSLFGSMSAGYMRNGRGDTEQEERAWAGSESRPDAA